MADKFSLPGIKTIGYLYVSLLTPNLIMRAQAGIPITIPRFTELDFSGEPECTCETVNAKNGCEEHATLSFVSQTRLSPEADYAFVVVDCHNNTYLIGAQEPPFPIMNRTTSFGSPAGEPRTVAYEIEHNSVLALIPCLTT